MANESNSNHQSNLTPHQATTASLESFDGMLAGRYRLGRLLGQGAYGQVFYAEDCKYDPPRSVALKLLHSKFTTDPQVREELKREASALARFTHPNILRVLDFEIGGDNAYIVTEYAAGGSLARHIQPDPSLDAYPLPLETTLSYFNQLSDALDHAHAQDIIHRDIKPQNILLDGQDRPLLADFGLAAAISNSPSSLADTTPSGTPLYMSPEQWQGHVGKASDIYSLGVVLFQLLTGQTPYKGNTASLAWQHCNAPVPRLADRAPWLANRPDLENLMAEVLDKDPRRRPRSAQEIYRRLVAALPPDSTANSGGWPPAVNPVNYPAPPIPPASSGYNLPSGPMMPPAYYESPPPPSTGRQPISLPVEQPRRSSFGLVAAIIAVVVVALGGVSLLLINNANKTSNQPTNQAQATATTQSVPKLTVIVGKGGTTPNNSTGSDTPFFVSTTAAADTVAPESTPVPTVKVAVPSPTPVASARGKVGETLKFNGYSFSVDQMESSQQIKSDINAYSAVQGYRYVNLKVTYQTNQKENLHTNLFFHSPYLRDSQNFIYPIDDFKQKDPALSDNLDELQPGDKVQGWLTYQIPQDAKGLVLTFGTYGENPFAGTTALFQVGLDEAADFGQVLEPAPKVVGKTGNLKETVGDGPYFMTVTDLQDMGVGRNGKKVMAAWVVFQSNSPRNTDVNFNGLSVKDGEGFRYSSSSSREPSLSTFTDLPPGLKYAGWVTFEIPTTAKNLTLEYTPLAGTKVTLRVNLGQ